VIHGSLSAIEFQQASQVFHAMDSALPFKRWRVWVDKPILNRLMVSYAVVVLLESPDRVDQP